MKKRLLVVILTLAMILSSMPMTALAAGDETENSVSATYSIGANEDGTDSYKDHATGWAAAVAASVKDGSCVKVVLSSDWEATDGTFGSSSDAFHEGALYVPSGANIVLDLNGKELNRGLNAESATQYGNVIYVEGALTVEDNGSDSETHMVTNPGYDSSAEGTSEADATITVTGGLITGGYVDGGTEALDETNIYDGIYGGAGILVYRGTLTLNGGTIAGNSVISHTAGHNGGGGVFVYGDDVGTGTFTMNDGTISYNSVAKNSADGATTSGVGGGGVLAGTINYATYKVLNEAAYYTTFTMNGGSIEQNVVSNGWGGGVYSGYAEVNLYAGSVSYNTNSTAGGGMCAGRSTKLTIGSPTASESAKSFKMENNTAGGFGGGIYLSSSTNAETTAIINSGSISHNKASAGGGIVLNGAHVEMTSGTISNNTVTGNGGGVYVLGGTAEFTISGGEISNNTANNGGGIFTAAKAALLGNGKLSGNVATGTGGGGVYVSGSAAEFTMSGGTIDGTLAEDSSPKVNASKGGGVFIGSGGKFTLTSGNIINNTASSSGGGVQVNNNDSTFVMSDGTIGGENGGNTVSSTSGNVQGGGVYSNGTVTMTGGEISYNTITTSGSKSYAYGGGVHLNGGTFTMTGTAQVSNNSATSENAFAMGGGVCVANGATFTMDGGAVTGNNVSGSSTSYGAGVCVNNTSSNGFIMAGGTISGNGLSSSGSGSVYGGGVGLRTTSKFTMTGGTITGNQATNGGGVYVYIDNSGQTGTFIVSGNPTITGNTGKNDAVNNVYLANITSNGSSTMKTITLDDELTGGIIGVTTATKLPTSENASAVQITDTESGTSFYSSAYAYFVSDANSEVSAQTNDSGYVEFAFTDEEVYSVSITGENISVESDAATVESGKDYTATIKACPGYVLQSVKVGETEETIATNATSYNLTISSVSSNQTVTVETKADSITASLDEETTVSGTYGTAITAVDLSQAITAAYKNGEKGNSAQIIAYSAEGLSDYGLTLSADGKITGTLTKATAANSTITVTVKALNGEISSVTLPINIDKVTLAAPEFTAAAASKTEITITWPAWPEGAASIKYKVNDGDEETVEKGTTTTTITGLTAGTAYTITANYTVDKDGNYKAADTGAIKTVTTTANSSSGSSSYTITAPTADNGTLALSSTRASKGATVTITVSPNSGYELDTLTVTDASGNKLALTKKSDTQYTFTMPASKVTVEAAFTKTEEQPDVTFTDVSASAYYYNAVAWAVENGVTYGTSATTFSPDETCTRAQTVTFLWRAAGSPAPESSANPFTDVQPGAYYYEAVLWAVEKGITNGTSPTTFSPDDTVTRGQTVTFLHRAAGSPAVNGGSFADVAADAYYAPAVQWAVANGITYGTSATTFSPDDPCTRGQIVTFLYRAYVG